MQKQDYPLLSSLKSLLTICKNWILLLKIQMCPKLHNSGGNAENSVALIIKLKPPAIYTRICYSKDYHIVLYYREKMA